MADAKKTLRDRVDAIEQLSGEIYKPIAFLCVAGTALGSAQAFAWGILFSMLRLLLIMVAGLVHLSSAPPTRPLNG